MGTETVSLVTDMAKGYGIACAAITGLVIAYCGLIVKGMLEMARHPNEEDRQPPKSPTDIGGREEDPK